jgi:adenosine deaminase
MNQYLESIRKNPEDLLNFFKKMPKGADIHHHALGALRPADILKKAVEHGYWIDTSEGWIYSNEQVSAIPAAQFQLDPRAEQFCQNKWTVCGFDGEGDAGKYFFDVFFKISPVFIGYEPFWLNKILEEATSESILYIETLIECTTVSIKIHGIAEKYEGSLDENSSDADFREFLEYLSQNGLDELKKEAIALCDSWIALISNQTTLLKFQLYTVRNLTPKSVLGQMILSYAAAANADNIVGVNLVAPEFDEFSLRYYSMHMRACKWLSKLYPSVNLALHAGELSDKLVEEKNLKFHIFEAISVAGAKRIGHGVDLMTEPNRNYILDLMSEKPVPIEILPESNRFILGVFGEEHPFESYHRSKVPVVVASDDPGVLDSDLATQYQKLALAYPYLCYDDFKEFAFNSIRHSFLTKESKKHIMLKLESQFNEFEQFEI